MLLASFVAAQGTIILDKEFYHPGEKATAIGTCTANNEQNRPGYFVWFNESGDILQSIATNSLGCRANFFFSEYTFLQEGTNYTGNVTFSLNADGSGIPIDWDDANDVRVDNFTVRGGGVTDCEIIGIEGGAIVLGEISAVKFKVYDAISGSPLVNARCQADGYNFNGSPILFEPYGAGQTFRYSGAEGEVGFQHLMNERLWQIDSSYLYEFHCHCPDSEDQTPCYIERNGTRSQFKSCSSIQAFFTTAKDERESIYQSNMTALMIMGAIFIFIYAGLGYMNYRFNLGGFVSKVSPWVYLGCFMMAIIQAVVYLGFMYADYLKVDYTSLMRINFYTNLILLLSAGLITVIYSIGMIFYKDSDSDSNSTDEKWQ